MKAVVLAVIVGGMVSVASGADMPQRKAGLWQIELKTPHSGGRTMPPMKQCIDEKTDQQLQEHSLGAGAGRQDCTKQTATRSGDTWVVDAVCKLQNSTATTHATMRGDFNAAYTIESQTRFDPPIGELKESSSKTKVIWLGACPANMKPGDVDVNGRVINVLEIQQQRAGTAQGGKIGPEQVKQMMDTMKKQQ